MLRLERKINPGSDNSDGWRFIDLETGEDLLPKLHISKLAIEAEAGGVGPILHLECVFSEDEIDLQIWDDETVVTVKDVATALDKKEQIQ